jgi:hypothetical protein
MIHIEISNNNIIGVYRINYQGKRKLLISSRDYQVIDFDKQQEEKHQKVKVNYHNQSFNLDEFLKEGENTC